ncbi:hypothetical protein NKH18_38640 [Streptomyces sp. M10(2022)]
MTAATPAGETAATPAGETAVTPAGETAVKAAETPEEGVGVAASDAAGTPPGVKAATGIDIGRPARRSWRAPRSSAPF